MKGEPEPDTATVSRFLRSRTLFVAVTLLVAPVLCWATLVYLHDEYHVFWQNAVALLAAYFGGSAALAFLFGRLTGRTRREITTVVVATIPACIVVGIGAFLVALARDGFSNLN